MTIRSASTLSTTPSLTATSAGTGTGVTYEGTQDADPRAAGPDEFRNSATINVDGEDGGQDADGNNLEVHGLLRFDNLFGEGDGQIPAGVFIAKATLTLNIFDEGSDLQMHRLLGLFDQTTVTWNDLTLNGNTEPGLQGDDVEATGVLRNFSGTAGVREIDVTEDLQLWSDGETNFGWGFTPTGTGGVDFDSAEAADAALRPKLSVEFFVGGGPEPLPGDIDGDGQVQFSDFVILSENFGMQVEPGTNGDIDGDGEVQFSDFVILSENFGRTEAVAAPAASASVDVVFATSDDAEDDSLFDPLGL